MPFDTSHNGEPFPSDEPNEDYVRALDLALKDLNIRIEVGRYRKSDADLAQVERYHGLHRGRLRFHWLGLPTSTRGALKMTCTSKAWIDPATSEAYQIVYVRVDRTRSKRLAVAKAS
jgi:hypothetical protein